MAALDTSKENSWWLHSMRSFWFSSGFFWEWIAISIFCFSVSRTRRIFLFFPSVPLYSLPCSTPSSSLVSSPKSSWYVGRFGACSVPFCMQNSSGPADGNFKNAVHSGDLSPNPTVEWIFCHQFTNELFPNACALLVKIPVARHQFTINLKRKFTIAWFTITRSRLYT